MTTHVERSIEVNVPVRTAYDQWTQFEDFPRFMGGVQQVRQVGDTLTHWVAEIAGVRREWDAEILEQVPDQKVAWAATTGATNAGTVYFDAVGADRTRVRLTLDYEPEGIIEKIGDVLDVVERQAVADLDRFKSFIESRGSATGGWRGNVDDTGAPLVGADAAAAGGVAASEVAAAGVQRSGGSGEAGVPGDVVAVGPTGDTRSTLHTEPGPARSTTQVADEGALGVSGDPVVVDAQSTGHGSSDAERTGAAAGAGTAGTGVTGFGTDTGLSSSPTSGVLTGDPGARTASHAGTGTGDLVGEPGGDWTREPGARSDVTEAATDPVGEDWAGPGERSGVGDTTGERVVQRNYADEEITTRDTVARDFDDRDISGEGTVERDFANRDITERDIANRGITTGMGGAHANEPTGRDAADDPDNPTRPSV